MSGLTPTPVIEPEFINLNDERFQATVSQDAVTVVDAPNFIPPPHVDESLNLGPHVVMVSCKTQVNGVLCILEAGKIINDPLLIKTLLGARAPIQAVNPDHSVLMCPHCKNLFEYSPASLRG